ncbi:MAG: ankyrin repeat domain-containing protein, partial [Bacteroidales bacterium]|nr:ankyrin repeat domain-containing protein [Bacteroidales bacterium]
LAAGADPSIQDPEGKSGLMHASLRNDVLLTLILLDAGANTNQTDPEGRTALHAAASSGAHEALYALLDHGASPQIADIKGITPLMITAFRGDLAISDLLIRYQAETVQKDHKGMDAASYAVSQGHYGTVAYLLDSIRTDAAWRPAALLALQTGQRKLYQEISRKSGARVNKPVGFAWDISTGMYWNGMDHFAFSEGSWIEARTNLAFGLSWMHRLGPVRVLDRSHEPWMQYRENRGALIAGIGKPLNISNRRSMRFEVLPRFSAGLSYANRRGAVTSPKHIVLAISEVRAGLRYRKAGIHAGLAWMNLRQEGISPWYFNAGISFRLSRINYKKLSLSI